MSSHFNNLTPEQLEALAILSEELGEVQQAIGKILRHGLDSVDPTIPVEKRFTNAVSLGIELGDVVCAMGIVSDLGIVDRRIIDDRSKDKRAKIGRYLHHVKVPAVKEETDKFNGVFTSDGGHTLNIFKMQMKSSIDLEAMQLNWKLPTVRAQEAFPVCRQTIPVLVVDDQQQVKSDLATIRFACQEEGYGLDAVRRLEKILTEPNATSQIVWAKKEEIERAKQLGASFNVWITRYSDLDTAMLLPPQEMVQKRSSLERVQKTKIDFPPPM